jgi:predicted ester cyclase
LKCRTAHAEHRTAQSVSDRRRGGQAYQRSRRTQEYAAGLAGVVPDLSWTINELFVSGYYKINVRGEATGTPIATFLGVEPTGRSFRTISIDLYTVTDSKVSRFYHVENWTRSCVSLPTADYIDSNEERPGRPRLKARPIGGWQASALKAGR